jgi:hypothetical protein
VWSLWGSKRRYSRCTPRPERGAPVTCPVIILTWLIAVSTWAGEGRIAFAQPIYDFGRVKAGDAVKHTFVFTNVGTEVLEVTNVQTSCGCATTGEWTRRVEAGGTGTIPVQFHTAGFGGEMLKTVAVYSTDKTNFLTTLQLKGTVWKPVDVVPSFAVLNILPDATTASTSVRITNNIDEHISILSHPKCSSPAFVAEIRTNQRRSGRIMRGRSFNWTSKLCRPSSPATDKPRLR